MGLRVLQTVVVVGVAFAGFLGLDTLNEPLLYGAVGVGVVLTVVIVVVRYARDRERRLAGLPKAASSTLAVALAFAVLDLVGSLGAGAVVWTTDTCTMQLGNQVTGFFAKEICREAEGSPENKTLGLLGKAEALLRQVPVVGPIAGAAGSIQLHDGPADGDIVCTGWSLQARWLVVTVRDQGTYDLYGHAMCNKLKSQGLLTHPWDAGGSASAMGHGAGDSR